MHSLEFPITTLSSLPSHFAWDTQLVPWLLDAMCKDLNDSPPQKDMRARVQVWGASIENSFTADALKLEMIAAHNYLDSGARKTVFVRSGNAKLSATKHYEKDYIHLGVELPLDYAMVSGEAAVLCGEPKMTHPSMGWGAIKQNMHAFRNLLDLWSMSSMSSHDDPQMVLGVEDSDHSCVYVRGSSRLRMSGTVEPNVMNSTCRVTMKTVPPELLYGATPGQKIESPPDPYTKAAEYANTFLKHLKPTKY